MNSPGQPGGGVNIGRRSRGNFARRLTGKIPEDWRAQTAKLARKDRDARWTSKRAKARKAREDGTRARVGIAIPVFGDKNHIGIDKAHRLIRGFAVTSASAHDGAQLPAVIARNTASDVWADTAYRTKANEAFLSAPGLRSKIHFRRWPGQDLTPPQRKANRARSRVRSAVEGVFAHQKYAFGLAVRTHRHRQGHPWPTSPTTSGAISGWWTVSRRPERP